MQLFELRKTRIEMESQADQILRGAETAKRRLDASEEARLNHLQRTIAEYDTKIRSLEKSNTITNLPMAAFLGGTVPGPRTEFRAQKKTLSADYAQDFYTMVRTKGTQLGSHLSEGADGHGGFVLPGFKPSAALYEGAESAGGYAVPLVVDDQIVPLAPQEMAVRRVATVIPTVSDIKIPQKNTFSTASAKAETASFTESEPTLTQITLSAFMAGVLQEVSWELAQDVPAFQAFAVDDMILAQQMYEENLYVNGSGSGQAQGLIGNVGAGYGPQELDSNNNTVTIAGLLNTIGTLNEAYHPNASWLMTRGTSVIIRKAQMQANLFFPAFTRVGTQDFLFGYPVNYSAYMPSAIRGNTPVLFGDFKRGYVIGDRGGSGINVKVLDQPLATQGLIQLLAYRRTDGRVRRSEAIQAYTVAAS
jgi:HK97 family phage major capsid protein